MKSASRSELRHCEQVARRVDGFEGHGIADGMGVDDFDPALLDAEEEHHMAFFVDGGRESARREG